MSDALFFAWRWIRAAPVRSAILVLGAAIAMFLPVVTWLAAERVEQSLLRRALETPILIGAKGNEFDLTMAALYFRGRVADTIDYGELAEISMRDGVGVPLHVGHSADGVPIVGTTPEYFERRGLECQQGRLPALLGEVVVGAEVAQRGIGVGDFVRTDLTNLYNLAGAYPSVLEVVGVLEPTATPDDEAYFTDVRTTWLLDGRVHGHEEIAARSTEGVPGNERTDSPVEDQVDGDDLVEASAAIFLFSRITTETRSSFHMHGGQDSAPVSAILFFPENQMASDLLLGDYALAELRRAVVPADVVRTILGIVLRARDVLSAYFVLIAISTLAFFGLVIFLGLRSRRHEVELMERIGCARGRVGLVVGGEIVLLTVAAAAIAALATWGSLSWLRDVL